MAELLIAGLGNELMGDDGVGPAVVRRLRGMGLPPGVRALEAGTDVTRLGSIWAGESRIWVVDALIGTESPGTLVHLGHHDLLALPATPVSPHTAVLSEALRWLCFGDHRFKHVRFRLWAVAVSNVSPRPSLSPEAECGARRLARLIHSSSSRQPSGLVSQGGDRVLPEPAHGLQGQLPTVEKTRFEMRLKLYTKQ